MPDSVPHNRPLVTGEDRRAVDSVLSSGLLCTGNEVAHFEEAFSSYLGGGASCAVSSGTAALYMALISLGVSRADRVAVPTYSCSAILNAVKLAGAEPVIIDVNRDTYCIDPDRVAAEARRSPLKATIVVHSFGVSTDLSGLNGSGGLLIEDCCQSLGSRRLSPSGPPEPFGVQGDIAVFSFYATKTITCGQGGLLHTGDTHLIDAARDYRDYDQPAMYRPRFNFAMTDFQAAMAASQFARLPEIVDRRRSIAAAYERVLPAGLTRQGGSTPMTVPFRFVVTAESGAARREVQSHLRRRGIQTIVPVEKWELLHRYLNLDPGRFPAAEQLADVAISLPIFPGLTAREVDAVIEALSTVRI